MACSIPCIATRSSTSSPIFSRVAIASTRCSAEIAASGRPIVRNSSPSWSLGESSMNRFKTVLATCALTLFSLVALAPRFAQAQPPGRQRTPNDTLKSVEVSPDHKVTFRIYAPKAAEVSVGGDFGEGGKLTKDEQGVWSITVGPLAPDYYTYDFNVDGVRIVDPKNPLIKQGLSNVDSLFLVPGDDAEFELTKDVPHGEIRAAWYRSGTLNEPRRLHVYTPPG